ncbi:DUF4245 domain-containing protein [Herbihabitans rhizosphaerae]|uniref:DUF4245 domain-containing protein n=1 Tax=Herbihabitans rhizosphaerae TaxID=1872711 RepID=UPI0013EEC8EA|nr:DUF4245 domain-containing protein [Herbihabitans rhizosphaerae]
MAEESDKPREDPGSARAASPRARASVRDMIFAVAVLLVMIAAILGFGRGCSFSPGGPTVEQSNAPSVDVAKELRGAAARVTFPVRQPVFPPSWRSNAVNVGSAAADQVAVRAGLITDRGTYLRLTQSPATVPELLKAETDREENRPAPKGEVTVSGTRWTVYPARRDEVAWVVPVDGVTVLITGNAAEEDFRTVATAFLAAAPIPRG